MNNLEIAKLSGRPTYLGRACAHGHTIRMTHNGKCYECKLFRAELRALKRKAKPPKVLTPEQLAARKEYYKKWREANADKVSAYNKAYRETHKQEAAAAHKLWASNHSLHLKAYHAGWRKKNAKK